MVLILNPSEKLFKSVAAFFLTPLSFSSWASACYYIIYKLLSSLRTNFIACLTWPCKRRVQEMNLTQQGQK